MTTIYGAQTKSGSDDFISEESAMMAVEEAGAGSVTTFYVEKNFMGGDVARSGKHIVYENGAWRGIDISRG